MKLYTADREAGNRIEEVTSVEEGMNKIAEYEAEDVRYGFYIEDFYDIIDEDGISII